MDEGDDPYEIIGVSSLATDAEIKKAYRKKALKCHPDKQQDPEAKEKAKHEFAKLAAAYEILTDENERKAYDEGQQGYERDSSEPSGGGGGGGGSKPKDGGGFRKKKHKKFNFNDPYDVFKKNFEDQFGFAYPGAKFDNVDDEKLEQAKKLKGKDKAPEKLLLTDGGTKGTAPSGSTAIVPGGKGGPTSTALVEHGGGDGDDDEPVDNNRPISIETKEIKIEHEDGTIETIEETTIKRPDGSTEVFRKTDKPNSKSGNWKKKEQMKALTNGESNDPKLAITNGPAPAPGKDVKAITNGPTPKKNTKEVLAISDGSGMDKKPEDAAAPENAEKKKKGGFMSLIPWKGKKK